jgi:hypothetical protein
VFDPRIACDNITRRNNPLHRRGAATMGRSSW